MAETTNRTVAVSSEALDQAFGVLPEYDWGTDPAPLEPINAALLASHDDPAARKKLEARLAAALNTAAPRAAKDFVCRKLSLIGSAQSVPALAALLPDNDLSHMARYALERIPGPQAEKALREALPKVEDSLKVGVINSLGVRRDAQSTALLAALLRDAPPEVAAAAAAALGRIGDSEAAKALQNFQKKAPKQLRLAAADACLACAEQLLADGHSARATAIFKALDSEKQPQHVRLAATRGIAAAAGKG